MEEGSLSRLAVKCATCKWRGDCDKKRLEACAYLYDPPLVQPALQDAAQPLMQDVLVRHDYRDIVVGENTMITIDLEEVKRRLAKSRFPEFFALVC